MGGTWPASIWHTYAEDMFVPLGVEPFPTPVFTGQTWNQVPPNLRKVAKKHKKHDNGQNGNGNGNGNGNPSPTPTFSCDPQFVTCATDPGNGGGNGGFGGTAAGRRHRPGRRHRRRRWRGPRRDRPAPVGPSPSPAGPSPVNPSSASQGA